MNKKIKDKKGHATGLVWHNQHGHKPGLLRIPKVHTTERYLEKHGAFCLRCLSMGHAALCGTVYSELYVYFRELVQNPDQV
jgi:hypothetical protein